MFHNRTAPSLGLLVLVIASAVSGQTPAPPGGQPPTAPGLRKLTGDDAKRAEELDKAIGSALKADRADQAIARAEELFALRTHALGPRHFETLNAQWGLETLRRVAAMSKEDRAAYESAVTMNEQAHTLNAQGKYAQAQPLYEKAMEIYRRVLTDDHPETAASFNNLANNLDDQGKYVQAQSLYENALAIRRSLFTDDHPETAQSYNNVAGNLSAQGKYTQAQPLVEKALEIRRRLLTDDHPDTANAYNNVAGNLSAQGKFAQAQPLFEKALEINRRLLTENHRETALSYNNVAYNLSTQGKYAQAQPLLEKALEIWRRLLTDEHPDTAGAYNNVAANLSFQGKYARAQPLFEKALNIRRRLLSDLHPRTAQSYSNLAGNLKAQGKYKVAQPLYETAMEIYRRLLTDDHPDTAACYNCLGLNLNAQGEYAQAQPLYEKALEIRRRLLTEEHPETAASYSNVAHNLSAQGNFAQAQALYEKALEICRLVLTDDHPSTAASYNNLAHSLNAQGKYIEAQPLFEKALEIRRRLLTDDHHETAESYNNVAYNLSAQGKYSQAQRLYELALEICRRRFTEDHPQGAYVYINLAVNLDAQGKYAQAQPLHEKASEIRRRVLGDGHPESAAAYNTAAYNLYSQGKYLEARDRWRSAAESLDAARLRVAFAGLERAGTVKSMRPALAAVLARLGEPAKAWQTLEEDLGRGLLDELAARQDRRLAPAERARVRELTAALEQLDRLVETMPRDLQHADRSKRFEELKRQRELASIALGEFQTKLVQDHGPLAGQVAPLNEIQAALPADAALIAWVDVPPPGPNAADADGEHWGVVVRSQGIPVWVSIAGSGPDGLWTKDDTQLAARVRSELRGHPGAGTADLRPLLQRLRIQRLEPLAKALDTTTAGLPPARRLIVLPSRAIAGIPIEALLTTDDTRTVSYAPSTTVFKYLREQPRPDRHSGLLALGDPVYERPDRLSKASPLPDHGLLINMVAPGSNAATHGLKPGDVLLAYDGRELNKKDDLKVVAEGDKPIRVDCWRDGLSTRRDLASGKLGVVLDPRPAPEAIAENRKLQQVFIASRSGGEDFTPLPGTRYEVNAVARLFSSDDRPTRILLEAEASEPELDRMAASGQMGRLGFIHLATHGVIDEAIPARSAVILTQTGLPDPLEQALSHKPVFDGRLSVREIQRGWELKAELVTLSACETALGRESGGESFVGFTQALVMSGARSVCLSLWKVDDTATALLMQRFYASVLGRRTGLSEPMPKAEALAEAKGWLRGLTRDDITKLAASLSGGEARAKGATKRKEPAPALSVPAGPGDDRPFAHPYFWAAFVLVGDPD